MGTHRAAIMFVPYIFPAHRRPERKPNAQGVLNEEAFIPSGGRAADSGPDHDLGLVPQRVAAYLCSCEHAATAPHVHTNPDYPAAWAAVADPDDHPDGDRGSGNVYPDSGGTNEYAEADEEAHGYRGSHDPSGPCTAHDGADGDLKAIHGRRRHLRVHLG